MEIVGNYQNISTVSIGTFSLYISLYICKLLIHSFAIFMLAYFSHAFFAGIISKMVPQLYLQKAVPLHYRGGSF